MPRRGRPRIGRARGEAEAGEVDDAFYHQLCLKAPIQVRSDSKGSVAPHLIPDLSGGVERYGGRTPESEDIALVDVNETLGRSLNHSWHAARRDAAPRVVGRAPDRASGAARIRASLPTNPPASPIV